MLQTKPIDILQLNLINVFLHYLIICIVLTNIHANKLFIYYLYSKILFSATTIKLIQNINMVRFQIL